MKKMGPWELLDHVSKHLSPSSYDHEVEENIMKQVVTSAVTSEYKFYCFGFGLKIPYHLMRRIWMKTLADITSYLSLLPLTLQTLLLEAGMRLLRVARNSHYRRKDPKHLKYFYRFLIPKSCVVPPYYFCSTSDAFQSEHEKSNFMWDVTKTSSPWNDDNIKFEHHFLQFIARTIANDYVRHSNDRREFSPNIANIPYLYTHQVADAGTLSQFFGKLGIMNSFFIQLGIVEGESHLEKLQNEFHSSSFDESLIINPPVPDMRILCFHSSMVMLKEKFGGDIWKFAEHFKHVYKKDIRRIHLRGLIKSLPIYDISLSRFSKQFIRAMIGKKKKITRKRKKTNDSSTTSSLDEEDRDDELSPVSIPFYVLKEYFFKPVIFSWSCEKCYF